MINPIYKNYKTKLIEEIPAEKIIERYKFDFNVDVSRFFSEIKLIKILECEVTGYRFFFPFSIMGDAKFYVDLSKGKKNYYHERWEHKIALNSAKNGDSWLEIGSGNSFFLQELTKRGVIAFGLELNHEEAFKTLKERFHVYNCDFFSYDSKNFQYDVIASFQVLEHVQDVSKFFIKANQLLKKNGKLIIGVPNNNPYLYVFDKFHTLNLPPHHMGLWNGTALKKVGERFGFKLVSLEYEPISQYELNYILKLFSIYNLTIFNIKFLILKIVRFLFPSNIFLFVSRFFRNYLVNGRNILIVFEKKND